MKSKVDTDPITLSLFDGASVVPMIDAKSLLRLSLPDWELGRKALPIEGVPGNEDDGVSSALSKCPPFALGPRLVPKTELSKSSTSFFWGVEGPGYRDFSTHRVLELWSAPFAFVPWLFAVRQALLALLQFVVVYCLRPTTLLSGSTVEMRGSAFTWSHDVHLRVRVETSLQVFKFFRANSLIQVVYMRRKN